ncbi:histidine phosphatase family protein [Campylobacter vulpis]|uniref:Histidine phosphatase family protein n=1 Tax=Campylobacter vulpis TaxID=1655500 RepID=A0ABS5P3M5_9BACT|nr:histidine phosphatase family protein [Campylobacter vulpis]MBS4240876.1 histidine phosphatase family protein [Campylobacter vulpis]MBS4252295.1 histidine phosphatase family protein [Campylobacter vulpis]MBS4281521.1 histidine phosphatase family protein [Campylobacter vulpis]MBS4313795.1 histidine phosphatase family protein [Campylobacter vulpis]
MKRIYILRHAKAQKEIKTDDFSRKLSKRGKNELKALFESLQKYEIKWDKIYASSAIRTKKTAQIMAKYYGYDKKDICLIDAFYEADEMGLFAFLKHLDEDIENVLLIGHNPALLKLCELLSSLCLHSFPTSSMLCLECENFKNLKEHSAKLVFFEHIKPLKEN